MSASPVIFQVRGVVTGVKDKSKDDYEMAVFTLDNHFEAACFGRTAKALLVQELHDAWVEMTVQAVQGEKYTNYNILHVSEVPTKK